MSNNGDQNSRPGSATRAGDRVPLIETDRLAVCALDPESDADKFFELTQDAGFNEFSIATFTQESVARAANWIAAANLKFTDAGLGTWGIYLREQPDTLIGICGLRPVRLDDRLADDENAPGVEFELMYRLIKNRWGQGIATECASALLEYGLSRLKLGAVIGFALPENVRSKRVLSKIGMQYDRASHFKGEAVDVYRADETLSFPRSRIAIPKLT